MIPVGLIEWLCEDFMKYYYLLFCGFNVFCGLLDWKATWLDALNIALAVVSFGMFLSTPFSP